MKKLIITLSLILPTILFAQTKVNVAYTKGSALVTPASTDTLFVKRTNGTDIQKVSVSSIAAMNPAWLLTGNSGTTAGTNFLGTTDAQDVVLKRNSSEVFRLYSSKNFVGIGTSTPTAKLNIKTTDTLFNQYALNVENNNSSNSLLFKVRNKPGFLQAGNSITHNLFFGLTAGLQWDTTIASRSDNIGIGESLDSLVDATDNIAIGYGTLKSNKHSPHNVAIGTGALNLFANTSSYGDNTAFGTDVMFLNTIGFQNTFLGSYSGYNVKSNYNVGIGYYAINNILGSILQGDENVAVGIRSLTNISNFSNSNTAIGSYSGENLGSNQANNLFVGYEAGRDVTSATGKMYFGTYYYAGLTVESRTPIVIQSHATDSSQQVCRINGVLNIQGGTGINATSGDAATINKTAGRFRKDASGNVFTLTNSYITSNSVIMMTMASDPGGAVNYAVFVVAGNGSATFTWDVAPANVTDINFFIIN